MNLQPGTEIAGYTIVERIGRGGMATVYKAYQPSLSRYVAIKVLPPYFVDDEDVRRRFRQEAQAVANLQHPHILVAYEYGDQDGLVYLVSELADGGTVLDMVGSPQQIDRVVELLGPIAAALDYAHAQGVLHRDVKPANILLRKDGTPLLCDFGLARMLHSPSTRLTRTGMTVGTPDYMAPEQATTEAITPAADHYGLAVVAYELLTGRVPFQGETPMVVLLAHMQEEPPRPSRFHAVLPPAIDAVLLKALAKRPEDRFGSAMAFIEALAAAGRGEALPLAPIGDRPEPPSAPASTSREERAAIAAEVAVMVGTAASRRRRRSAVLGGAALTAALIAAALWTLGQNARSLIAAHPATADPTRQAGSAMDIRVPARATHAREQVAALPPTGTPTASATRVAATPTVTATIPRLAGNGGVLPPADTPTPRPPSPSPTLTRAPSATAARTPAHVPSPTPHPPPPTPRPSATVHAGAIREVAAVRPPRPTATATHPPPTPMRPRPSATPLPTRTPTPLPAVPLVVRAPAPRAAGVPAQHHRATKAHRPAAHAGAQAATHRKPAAHLVLVKRQPIAVLHPAARKPRATPHPSHAAVKRKAAAYRPSTHGSPHARASSVKKKAAGPSRTHRRRPSKKRQGSLIITVRR